METEYLYAFVKCGRKAFHLHGVFTDWEEVGFDRGEYTEHITFRKPINEATEKDRQLARDYGTPFSHGAA